MAIEHVKQTDPEVAAALGQELSRQRSSVELIASENFTSRAVMEAMGSVLTNKYAEGLPGKRYYGVLASCMALSLRTFSLIPAQMPTLPHISPPLSLATPLWV